MIIESKDNKLIKYAKQIQIKKYSSQFGECFLETEKVVFDCLDKNMEISTIFVLNTSLKKYEKRLKIPPLGHSISKPSGAMVTALKCKIHILNDKCLHFFYNFIITCS